MEGKHSTNELHSHLFIIKWVDKNNKVRRYYPDFYLPDYNVYLDPKNPYCLERDKEKLNYITNIVSLIYDDIKLIKDEIFKMVRVAGFEPAVS